MTVLRAAARGLGRALGSPKLLVWLWLANLLAALPAAVLVGESIRHSVGESRVDEGLRDGFDMEWWGGYKERTEGIAATLTPTHSGPGAWFANLEAWLSGDLFLDTPAVVAMGIGYASLWTLLLGGVLEQWVRPAPAMALERFLAAAGRFYFRLLRLTALTAGLYYGIYRFARSLFPWLERLTEDVTVEKTVLAWYLVGAAAVVCLLVLVRMVSDYAKITLVAERRRSSLLALLGGVRFVLLNPLRTYGTALLFGLLGAALLAAFSLLAPGAAQADWAALVGAFVVSQIFLVAKLVLRLGFLGAEVAIYQQPPRGSLPPTL